ncbi:MAG: sensor histidine kinase [Acidimicrobiales bacterium]
MTRADGTSGGKARSGDERPYWRDGRYWVVLLAIASLYVARLVMSVALGAGIVSAQPELTTLAVFLVPILYLALNVSTEGAVTGAMWVLVLSIPRIVAYYQERSYVGVWAQAMQVMVLVVIAILVGRQVSAERNARLRAEGARKAHLAAEARYRGLFESNGAPILLVGQDGNILEANTAALTLFPVMSCHPAGSEREGSLRTGDDDRFTSVTGALDEKFHALEDGGRIRASRVSLGGIIGDSMARQILVLGGEMSGFANFLPVPPGTGGAHGRTVPYSPGSTNGCNGGSAGRSDQHADPAGSSALVVEIRIGEGVYVFRLAVTIIHDGSSQVILQLVFEDVTNEAARLQNAETYARGVLGAQEDERKRLAQELHDGPLQSLIHLCRQVDAVSVGFSQDDKGLQSVRDVAEAVVGELRSIARGLRPSILDDLGLVTAMSRLLSDVEARSGIKATLGVHGMDVRLPPHVESCLFRVAQEALSNVERHSHAHRVAVGLEANGESVHFLVNDDGVGFAVADIVSQPAFPTMGLAGMRERVGLLGGRLYIRSSPSQPDTPNLPEDLLAGSGTSIEVLIPVGDNGSVQALALGGPVGRALDW